MPDAAQPAMILQVAKLKIDVSGKVDMSQDNQEMMDRILAGVEEIPPMPEVVFKAQQLLADPDSSAKELAALLETDQAIATKVLKMANSAFYGMSGKVSSIQHASLVLGYRNLGEIITVAGVQKSLERKLPGYGLESEDLWRHSVSVALGSKIIASRKNPELEMVAHTAGLIHDVGKIILDPFVLEEKENFEDYIVREQETILNAEQEILGFDHGEVAAEVCRKWRIPEVISSAIRYHHSPSSSLEVELAFILHLADYISLMSGEGYENDDYLYELEEGTLDYLDFNQSDVSDLTLELMESVADLLDPPN
jgi:putative nucleotidyltransferase with HDIG domain